jgi:hypothetical protein
MVEGEEVFFSSSSGLDPPHEVTKKRLIVIIGKAEKNVIHPLVYLREMLNYRGAI